MQKIGFRYQAGLSVLMWLALSLALFVPLGQAGPLDNFTFGFYGNNRESLRLNREDVIAREGYCPSGGCVLRLDRVTIKPDHARKGATLLLTTTYTILTPAQVALPVVITREIFYHGKSLGQTKSIETRRQNGTWTQEINFTLPTNAASGIYRLETKITTGYGTAMDNTDFQVE
jgi:hypothetical protein